jgi:hypothetical protein
MQDSQVNQPAHVKNLSPGVQNSSLQEIQLAMQETKEAVEGLAQDTPKSDPVFELAKPPTAPGVTTTLASVNAPATDTPTSSKDPVDISGIEDNLVELISLMKSGGIAVYLDSKKVNKQMGMSSSN